MMKGEQMYKINTVPHLTTAITGPLRQLEQQILDNQVKIETWLRKSWQLTPPPLYASIDLRNAGFKLAPVDTNLFSAGFNNLNPDFLPLCIQAVQATINQRFVGCDKILIVPENHTSNIGYFENLAVLQTIFTKAGYDTRVGSLLPDLKKPTEIKLPSGNTVTLEPVTRSGNQIGLADFVPCIIVLNNDLSEGTPALLTDLEQPVIPSLKLGWHTRLKSIHFAHYDNVANLFAELIGIDPWLVNPLFAQCDAVNLMEREGEECLMHNINLILNSIQRKYDEYGIEEKPFVVVKADAGTYGMGVMMVRSADEIALLNRKQRNKMSTGKGKVQVSKMLVQEGVYSFEKIGEPPAVAEPVVYTIGQYVVGGFYRVHKEKTADENLNAPGASFEALAFVDSCCNPSTCGLEVPNRFYAYGVIARLAVLAAAREIEDIENAD